MKKLLSIIVLSLLLSGNTYADHSTEHRLESLKEARNNHMLKTNAKCQNILNPQHEWVFLFSQSSRTNYYVKTDEPYLLKTDGYESNNFLKKFSRNSSNYLTWFELYKDSEFKKFKDLYILSRNEKGGALVINSLKHTAFENDLSNYYILIIFFNADYKRAEYEKLEKLYKESINEGNKNFGTNIHIKYQEAFFDEVNNFIRENKVLSFGKESFDKGNWANVLRAKCKPIGKGKTKKIDRKRVIKLKKE
tara:strand:+ start:525 stop:1271 length:747 start_codon:yes stop_codon:yes gene_type:complete